MTVPWSKIYNLNEASIDKEHRQLFMIANEAFVVVKPTKRQAKVKGIVQKLYTYTKTHFEHEEIFMQSIEYPELKSHKKLHEKTMEEISELIRKLPLVTIAEFEKELARFLFNFANQHILKHDMKIKEWMMRCEQNEKTQKQKALPKLLFALSHSSLDDEHFQIFELYEKVLTDTFERDQTLQILQKYCDSHFVQEETFMEKIHFSDRDEHTALHTNIKQELQSILDVLNSLPHQEAQKKLLVFFETTLLEHIQKEDSKIAQWVQEVVLLKNSSF